MDLSARPISLNSRFRWNENCRHRRRGMKSASENRRLLEAARGYVTLGLFQHANGELEQISRDMRFSPEVLAVKLAIFSGLKLWEMAEIIAWQLAERAGENPALRRLAESATAMVRGNLDGTETARGHLSLA